MGWNGLRALSLLAMSICLAATTRAHAVDAGMPAAEGGWLDQSGRAGIEIARCGDKLCGTIRWLSKPLADDGKPKRDVHNPDPTLRDRPVCGLVMLGGFVPGDDPGRWRGGWIYDPEHGDTYKSNLHVNPDGTLSVRGYIGIALIGKSQTWTRFKGVLAAGNCTKSAS